MTVNYQLYVLINNQFISWIDNRLDSILFYGVFPQQQ
jgi:hypothetical protein